MGAGSSRSARTNWKNRGVGKGGKGMRRGLGTDIEEGIAIVDVELGEAEHDPLEPGETGGRLIRGLDALGEQVILHSSIFFIKVVTTFLHVHSCRLVRATFQRRKGRGGYGERGGCVLS